MLLQSIMDTATSATEEKTMVRKDRDFIVNKSKGPGVLGFTQGSTDVQLKASTSGNGGSDEPHKHMAAKASMPSLDSKAMASKS